MEITSEEEEAKIHVPVSQRGDSGTYNITLSNPYGEDSGDIKVVILGMWAVSKS